MNKPPPERTKVLINRLLGGGPLSLTDRIAALWYVRAIEGDPVISDAERRKWDTIAAKIDAVDKPNE